MTPSGSGQLPEQLTRSVGLSVLLGEKKAIDLAALFSGQLDRSLAAECAITSPLSGQTIAVPLRLLQGLAQWLPSQPKSLEETRRDLDVGNAIIRDWLRVGLIVPVGENDGDYNEMMRRHEMLKSSGWESASLTSFAASRWSQKKGAREQSIAPDDRDRNSRLGVAKHIEKHGPMPSAYHLRVAERTIELPDVRSETALSRILAKRETTRLFDESQPLPMIEVSETLRFAFGARGESDLGHGARVLKKYNPSGGALHSIEAYPLLLNVEGAAAGLYHYNVEHHRLDQLQAFDRDAARELVVDALAGQHWYQSAHAIVFMTSRFERAFWKYRQHTKAYKSIVMDAGHISQTIYLLAAERGLGAFVTMAMNDVELEQLLGIDFVEEGLIAACGIGVRKTTGDSFSMQFEPKRDDRGS